RIIDEFAKQLRLPDHVAIGRDLADAGNTSAASIPLAMHRLLEEQPDLSGGLALQIGFGAGLVYGAQVIRLPYVTDLHRPEKEYTHVHLNAGTPIYKELLMANKDEILSGLAEIVNEETGLETEEVQLEKNFTEDLDIDSISMMTIVVNAEEKFDVKIPDEEVKNLKTVQDAV